MTDKFGNNLSVGDRIVFCHRGWDGKDANLQLGTITRITNKGVWCKPDNAIYGRNYHRYDFKLRKYVEAKDAPTTGWKWSTKNMVVKVNF